MAIVSVIGGLFLIAGRAPTVGVLLVATGVIYLATHWTWGSDS